MNQSDMNLYVGNRIEMRPLRDRGEFEVTYEIRTIDVQGWIGRDRSGN